MTKVISAMSVSLDGFIAGPNDGPGNGLGDGGAPLFEWINQGDPYGMKLLQEGMASAGAMICGRNGYDIAHEEWDARQMFSVPVFVLTHRPEQDFEAGNSSYSFVGSIEEALEKARAAIGDADKAIALHGGTPLQQALQIGEVDEIYVHVAPLLLGAGRPLFGETGIKPATLELVKSHASELAVFSHYRVVK